MPTRNRARFLRLALQSALELRGGDYEVVVSDNCSSDDTAEVVAQARDSRVRYVRTPRSMAISEHTEFVLAHARGEYLTFLYDDDALPAGMLESARRVLNTTHAELLAWPSCNYFYPDWHDVRHRNSLLVWPYSGRVEEVASRDTLVTLYRTLEPRRMPNWTNALYHRALIDRTRRRTPRLFPPLLAADVYGSVILLVEAKTYYWIDIPLTVCGRWLGSVGASLFSGRGRAGPAYVREFPADATHQHVPLKTFSATNLRAEALLRVKSVLATELAEVELDWPRYFVRCFSDLLHQDAAGGDVSDDLRKFHSALSAQPDDVREAVLAEIRNSYPRRSWRRTARRIVTRVPLLGWVESVLRPVLKDGRGERVCRGREAGFANILECARVLDRLLSERCAGNTPGLSDTP